MEKITFIDKGETGYEDVPINAENLNAIQDNVENAIEDLSSNVLTFEVIGSIDD